MAALALPAPITIGPAFRRLQLVDIGGEAGRGTGGGEGCVEQVAQQRAGVGIFHLRNLPHYRGAMQPLLGPGRSAAVFRSQRDGQGAAAAALRPCQQGRARGAGRSRHLRRRAVAPYRLGHRRPRCRDRAAEASRRAAGRVGLFAAGDRLQPLAGRRGLDARGQRRHARAGQQGPDQGTGRCPRRGLLLALSPRSRPPARSHDGRRPQCLRCW